MTMQTDVRSAHLNSSGVLVPQRTRLKSFTVIGTTTNGQLVFWDDLTATPTAVTYARTGNLVTITHNAHGLQSGAKVGLHFLPGTGGTATDGNYTITKLTDNTYTVQDINSGSITAGATAYENGKWAATIETNAQGDAFNTLLPGEGLLFEHAIYAQLVNIDNVTVFYG
jgi:hypothetical protein